MVHNWTKFQLLMWKNWILQRNHKFQLFLELALPILCCLLLVILRNSIRAEHKPGITYPQFDLDLYYLKYSNIMNESVPRHKKKRPPIQLKLLYSPNNSMIFLNIVREVTKIMRLEPYSSYANAKELEKALVIGNYFAGIQFDNTLTNPKKYPNILSYSLRFPGELRQETGGVATWGTNQLHPFMTTTGPRNPTSIDGGHISYAGEGFTPLQHAISTAYIRLAGNFKDELPEVVMQRFPYPPYLSDPFLGVLEQFMLYVILLSYIYSCINITKYITAEKEIKVREYLKIMGVPNWIQWMAWFSNSFLLLFIESLLLTTVLKMKWANNIGILNHSAWTVLFFFFLIYSIASICFCFMLASFFTKPNTAAAIVGFMWFLTCMPFNILSNTFGEVGATAKILCSLLTNSALGFALRLIINAESRGVGIQWKNIFEIESEDEIITFGDFIIIMLVSSALYITVCMYVEQILPGDSEVVRKWYFPLTKQFWFGKRIQSDFISNATINNENPQSFQQDEYNDKIVGLELKNLHKTFGNKIVANNISLKIYENEITVLLGHNGAGKTIMMSMITGTIPPTFGTVFINGFDIRMDTLLARHSLGFCPQHNALFDDLTVANHVDLFSRLKGVKGDNVQKEVDRYLKALDVEDIANTPVSYLSESTKRKLSLCAAFCGGTKVVVCDEPTSPMDPAARRKLWNFLLSEKDDRTILLSTHYMDEADVLADRVAVMRNGLVNCYGSPYFLKQLYGTGYRLICVKHKKCNSKQVTRLLQRHIPFIEIESELGSELAYQLPQNFANVFQAMFTDLEANFDALKISGYSITSTNLEDVFMEVGAEYPALGSRMRRSTLMSGGTSNANFITPRKVYEAKKFLLTGNRLLINQWKGLLYKKLLYTQRNKALLIVQNLMPIYYIILAILIVHASCFTKLKPLAINLAEYSAATVVLERQLNVAMNSIESRIADQYIELIKSYPKDAYKIVELLPGQKFSEYILDLGKENQLAINTKYLAAVTIGRGRIIAWLNNQPLHTSPLTLNLVHNAMARVILGKSHEIRIANAPLPYKSKTHLYNLDTHIHTGFFVTTNLSICMSYVTAFYLVFVVKERESRLKLLQFIAGVGIWSFWFSQLLWDFFTFAVTATLIVVTLYCFQMEGYQTFEELERFFLMLLLFGFAVLPFTYLLAYLFTDPAHGFARVSLANAFSGVGLFLTVVWLETYEEQKLADRLTWIARIVPHFSLAKYMENMYINTMRKQYCKPIRAHYLPNKKNLCAVSRACCEDVPFLSWNRPGILHEIVFLIFAGVFCFGALIIIQYRKKLQFKYNSSNDSVLLESKQIMDIDVAKEQILVHNMRRKDLKENALVADRLTKSYKNRVVVNKLSLHIKQFECFGLLGTNGAGKTTTMKMLTGDTQITSGRAFIKGISLRTQLKRARREIGYCPQFDAFLKDLTGQEVLKFFCLLRGIPSERIDQLCVDLATLFGFSNHIEHRTASYSVGSNRKLSLAIAVIGNPSVVYLDEPTTGMDPASRRQVWKTLCGILSAGESIFLTSHNMEMCEALCTRVGVMINGEFKCIGTQKHLSGKFSKGLVLKIKTLNEQALELRSLKLLKSGNYDSHQTSLAKQFQSEAEADELFHSLPHNVESYERHDIETFVKNAFPKSYLCAKFKNSYTFYVPMKNSEISQIFTVLEANKDDLGIEEYSINQTSLEEIFLRFVQMSQGESDV